MMKRLVLQYLAAMVLVFFTTTLSACMTSTVHPLLATYQWQNRLILIFSPGAEDSLYLHQLEELQAAGKGLQERDLLVFHIFPDRVLLPNGTYLGEAEAQSLREHFTIPGQEMVALLMGKDGGEKLRSRELLTTKRLFQTIDAMPMRQNEMEN